MKKAFADLANSDGQVRDDAFVWLMGLNPTDLPALRKLVRQSLPLAPEQLASLKQIVMHVYLTGETYDVGPDSGFLGIFLPTQLSESGDSVVVLELMPGFVGERMLREGDVIVGILERPSIPLAKSDDLKTALTDVKPGKTIHFQVLRRGRILQLAITLDVRPAAAANAIADEIRPFNAARRARAAQYWDEHFADLLETPQAQ